MSMEPLRFILRALDPDHGSPVLETAFSVIELEDLRALLGVSSDDDPKFEGWYTLGAAELAAITERFGAAFNPEGREVRLCSCPSVPPIIPYLLHQGYELPPLLEGRKQFARIVGEIEIISRREEAGAPEA